MVPVTPDYTRWNRYHQTIPDGTGNTRLCHMVPVAPDYTTWYAEGKDRRIHRVASWRDAGSIPDGVTGICIDNPSGRTMALGSTQSLTEIGIFPGV
jgi:hypothetical protein